MPILALYNMKGGVGKTAAAVNLAYLAGEAGYRTLLWDLDPQGSAGYYLGTEEAYVKTKKLLKGKRTLKTYREATPYENLMLMPADLDYRDMGVMLDDMKKSNRRIAQVLRPVRRRYDFIILDCPPTLNQVAESLFRAADALLVPVIPTTLSMRTLEQVREFIWSKKKRRVLIRPFFSMVDRRKRLHRDTVQAYTNRRDGFMETVIPYASAVEQMGERQAPLPSFDRRSPAVKAFRALWQEVEHEFKP